MTSRFKQRPALHSRFLFAAIAAVFAGSCSLPQGPSDRQSQQNGQIPDTLAPGDARRFTKLIRGSVSPDSKLAVAVGTADRSRPQWRSARSGQGGNSYMLTDSSNTANYLVSLEDFRALGTLDSNHPGTAASYNHQAVKFHWSLDSRWLTEEHHWKWHTDCSTVHRLAADGVPQARLDLLPVARAIMTDHMLTRVPGSEAKDIERYALVTRISKITNDGFIDAKLIAEIPKSNENGAYLESKVRLRVVEGRDGTLGLRVTRQ